MERIERIKEDCKRYTPQPVEMLYTVDEVSEILRVHPGVVRKLIEIGAIKRLLIGSTKIRGSEITRFLDEAEGKDYRQGTLLGGGSCEKAKV